MKVNYGRDFSPEELQRISGRKRTATRKEVKAWLDGLVSLALTGQPLVGPAVAGPPPLTPSTVVHTTLVLKPPSETLRNSVDTLDKLLEDIYVGRRRYDSAAYVEAGELMQQILQRTGVAKQ